jgi:hypothetical protein
LGFLLPEIYWLGFFLNTQSLRDSRIYQHVYKHQNIKSETEVPLLSACKVSRPEISLHLKRLILWNINENNELNVHNVTIALPLK